MKYNTQSMILSQTMAQEQAAVFYLGVKTNVQYQIKNDLNPGMIFIMNKE